MAIRSELQECTMGAEMFEIIYIFWSSTYKIYEQRNWYFSVLASSKTTSWMVSEIPIHTSSIQSTHHIQASFLQWCHGKQGTFYIFRSKCCYSHWKKAKQKNSIFWTQVPHNIFKWKELNRFFADATKTGGNFLIKNKKGCDPVTVYFFFKHCIWDHLVSEKSSVL